MSHEYRPFPFKVEGSEAKEKETMMNLVRCALRLTAVCRIRVSFLVSQLKHRRLLSSALNTGFSLTPEAKADNVAFMRSFPRVVRDLTANDDNGFAEFFQHFQRALESNVPQGIMFHGLLTVNTYKVLHKKPHEISDEEIYLASVVGWSYEIMRGLLNILDDIVDNSEIRYGHPCWYRNKEVGKHAVFDSMLMYTRLFELMKRYFHGKPYYVPLIELLHQFCWESNVGQHLDVRFALNFRKTRNLEEFTFENYERMLKMKSTASVYGPILGPMYMHGLVDLRSYSHVRFLSFQVTKFATELNDFLEIFGDYDETGKLPSDIAEGKCTWLMITALHMCNSEQREILQDNYGKEGSQFFERVKKVFVELQLDELFKKHARDSHDRIVEMAEDPTSKLPGSIFRYAVDFLLKTD